MATQEKVARGYVSFEDFIAAADEDSWAEWVDGEVVSMSPVSERHAMITVFLTSVMNLLVTRRRLGRLLHAPFYMRPAPELPAREPDVMFVRAENVARIQSTFLDGPADLVIEVVSPESRGRDRGEKHWEYEQGGVGEYWLIDPMRAEVELYRRSASGRFEMVSADGEGRLVSSVLEGMWLMPQWLWSDPVADPVDVLVKWGVL
jgi:Uma2 family endonuclease